MFRTGTEPGSPSIGSSTFEAKEDLDFLDLEREERAQSVEVGRRMDGRVDGAQSVCALRAVEDSGARSRSEARKAALESETSAAKRFMMDANIHKPCRDGDGDDDDDGDGEGEGEGGGEGAAKNELS